METTNTVELRQGYVDESGAAHKRVTLRTPTMADEVVAEREATKAGFNTGSSYFACAMIAQCIASWEGIALVTIEHVLALTRADGVLLQSKLNEIEARDAEAQTSKNSPGGAG